MAQLVTKDILVQYADLVGEVKDDKKRIAKLESKLQRIESEKVVSDSVKGGEGGTRNYRIEGFPYPEYSTIKTLLDFRKLNLKTNEMELLKTINRVEAYINSLQDARMRRILKLKYIDDLTWIQVAHRMGKRHTADSCRKNVERFFQTN